MVPVLGVVVSTQRRGAEVFATDLAAALEVRGLGARTMALAPSADGARLDLPTLGKSRSGPRTLQALRAQSHRYEVVVAHGSHTLPACAVAMVGSRTPFVYRNIGDPRYWAASPARRHRVSLLLSRARAVAVLWPGAAGTLMRRHRVPAAKIHIIPNGSPASRFPLVGPVDRAAARAELGVTNEHRVVVYVGSLSREKNVHLAIAAVGALPDVALVIVGQGPERARLVEVADQVAPERVRFLGSTTDPQRVYAVADAVVLPSQTEGMPAVLIEAGLSGLPIVATAVGGVAEVVADGETGRLVTPGDVTGLTRALGDVLDQPGQMGAAARGRCLERFEIDVVASLWYELLTQFTPCHLNRHLLE